MKVAQGMYDVGIIDDSIMNTYKKIIILVNNTIKMKANKKREILNYKSLSLIILL